MNYDELATTIRKYRDETSTQKEQLKLMLEQVKASDMYQTIEKIYKTDIEILENAISELQKLGLETFFADPSNKKPYPGVQIKVFHKAEISDEEAAKAWVRENMKAAISEVIDWDMVKDFAKKNTVPGVTMTEEVKAQIASKL